MKVSELMSTDVQITEPDVTIADAARLMAMLDIGYLPVGENDQLVGSVTDRDLVIRGIAEGLSGSTLIRDVMSADVKYCYENDEVDDITLNMAENGVRRMPVVDQDKRLTGIFSLGDAAKTDPASAGKGLRNIAQSADSGVM